jgi:origin recognition complex subunit 2
MSDDGSPASSSGDEQTLSRTTLLTDDGSRFIHHTAFDAYFEIASKSSKTSSNVLSALVPPLTRDEYVAAITPVLSRERPRMNLDLHRTEFWKYARELDEGFNLLFYGFGSKRTILNEFAHTVCSARGNVVIANGYLPSFTLKDLFTSAERVPEVASAPPAGSGIEAQAARIRAALDHPAARPLYLIIHNIDSPSLRTTKSRACLSLLAFCKNIRIAASVDHINAPLLFSTHEVATRKDTISNEGDDAGTYATRGYAWLWHDLTTLAPYDLELAHADRSSIAGVSAAYTKARAGEGEAGSGINAAAMSETAAQHVLASVTAKARKMFVLMARRQLEVIADAGETAPVGDMRAFAVAYDALFALCRDQFIATTDGALRALLGEFKDHGLVMTTQMGGAGAREGMWIPLRKERLAKLLKLLDVE